MHNTNPLLRLTWFWLLAIYMSPRIASSNTQNNRSGPGSRSAPFLDPRSYNTTYSNLTLAPYVHNVSTTYAWVLPQNRFDIGAGAMACECFDPADTCCMPQTTTIGPFCISGNATCCGDAYCNANETCCGGACCPASTTCSVVNGIPGCCPLQTTCTGPPTCLDLFSDSCGNQSSAPAQCCPTILPACSTYSTGGQACYVSDALATCTSSTFTFTVYETMTVIPLGTTGFTDVFPTLSETHASNEVVTTVWAVDILSSALPTSTSTSSTSSSRVAGLCDPGPCYPPSTTSSGSATTTDISTITTLLGQCYDPLVFSTDPACLSNTAYTDGPYTMMPISDANDEKGSWWYAALIPFLVTLTVHLLLDLGVTWRAHGH